MDTDTISYPIYVNKAKDSLDNLSFIERDEEDQLDLNFVRTKSSNFFQKENLLIEDTDDLSTLVSSLCYKEKSSEMSSLLNSSNKRNSKQINMKGRVLINSVGFESKSDKLKKRVERVSCVFK